MRDFLDKYNWILLVSLSLVFIAVLLFVKPKPIEVSRLGEWKETPIIINCPNSLFSKEDVQVVVELWEDRGHSFLDIVETDCIEENVYGIIMIKSSPEKARPKELGFAHVSYSEEGEVLGVTIEVFVPNLLVLEHEMGHALGYRHVDQRGHIMYPDFEGAGLNDEGLYRGN